MSQGYKIIYYKNSIFGRNKEHNGYCLIYISTFLFREWIWDSSGWIYEHCSVNYDTYTSIFLHGFAKLFYNNFSLISNDFSDDRTIKSFQRKFCGRIAKKSK